MPNHILSPFITIHSEGALLPPDLLQRILAKDPALKGLSPVDYGLTPSTKLNEETNKAWNSLVGFWENYLRSMASLDVTDPATTVTREKWMLPMFNLLGFGKLLPSKAVELSGKSYPISHSWYDTPIHVVGSHIDLDRPTKGIAGAARLSPHSMLQEYLNNNDKATWGILSNGRILRILRDNTSLTRQSYLEFDLEAMFNGEIYADFVPLWLICHVSRFEVNCPAGEESCWLDRWSLDAQERGTRALDRLRTGVENAIQALGQGFLDHPSNTDLRKALSGTDLSRQDFYTQTLRLVYRLIFLFTAEDRGLLHPDGADTVAMERYMRYFSSTRLRRLAERSRGSRHSDLYEQLKLVMDFLAGSKGCLELGLPALSGSLFSSQTTPNLSLACLSNAALLKAVYSLAFITDGNTRRAVDYRNLGAEELGSVYESLLELVPKVDSVSNQFVLINAAGNQRKTTGSYYTPTSLIQELLNSALDPVIADRIGAQHDAQSKEQALLSLKVCDPASGSGHFLIAAAHRIARRLAEIRAAGSEPSPNLYRLCLRDVISHCIYGVDMNPMAVELCKFNLWMESLEPGKPLTFLDGHIKCGNSLVGMGPRMTTKDLVIPEDAFKPVTGDNKTTAAAIKRRNHSERTTGQMSLTFTSVSTRVDLDHWLAEQTGILDKLPEDNPEDIQQKSKRFKEITSSKAYLKNKQIADLWTSAFFWQITSDQSGLGSIAPTHGELNKTRSEQVLPQRLTQKVEVLAKDNRYFHWSLEFPCVFGRSEKDPGFDCILGNPPWERIKLQEEEWFATRDPDIAAAQNKSIRGRMIHELIESNPVLYRLFLEAKHAAECESKFMRFSERYPLSAVGDLNTYPLFAEHNRFLMGAHGNSGFIVPTGIATDDTTKDYFADLVDKRSIVSMYDFENKEAIFVGVHRSYKFCLLTLSGRPVNHTEFVFFATRTEHLRDNRRRFTLSPEEIALLNPNTHTMPVFRTRIDKELTEKIYMRVPILINERTGNNPWGVSFLRMFDMSNDSHLFSNQFINGYVRLYEAKMFHQFDHRWTTMDITRGEIDRGNPIDIVKPNYWVQEINIKEDYKNFAHCWLAFRNTARSTDERTTIFSIVPYEAVGNNAPIINLQNRNPVDYLLLLSLCNSFTFDFLARQKVAGISLNFFYVKQFPIIPIELIITSILDRIIIIAFELVFTAWDLLPLANQIWNTVSSDIQSQIKRQWVENADKTNGGNKGAQRPEWCEEVQDGFPYPPFKWDDDRRALLRAELDAYFAKLYGLSRDELRYILDPQEVYGEDFPGETFRVLKEKEIRKFGEYRSRRLVLEAWDRLEGVEVSNSAGVQSIQVVEEKKASVVISTPKPVVTFPVLESTSEPEVSTTDPAPLDQPSFADLGLFKCLTCGKLIMGADKNSHIKEVHHGTQVEWKQLR